MADYFEKMGKILADLDYRTVSGLADRIIFSIEKRKKKAAETRAAVFAAFSVGSIAGLYFLLQAAAAQFSATGTPQLFSLVFSDFNVVMANFGDYFASVAESFPALPVAGALFLALVLPVSLIAAVKNFKKAAKMKLTYVPRHS